MNGTNTTWWRTLTIWNMDSLLRIRIRIFLVLKFQTLILFIIIVEVTNCRIHDVIIKLFLVMILRIAKIVLKIRQYWVPLKERDDYYFKWNLLKSHIKFDIEKDLILNGMFIKKSKKKQMTNECKSLKL